MRISIALATYNGASFLDEQLATLVAQTHLPHEVVVSDDASTDATPELIDAFRRRAPFEVVVRRNAERIGWIQNFFQAVQLCTGSAIALCDQDDLWDPSKLEKCGSALTANQDVSMVAHAGQFVDASGRPLAAPPSPKIRRRHLVAPGELRPFASFPGYSLMFRSRILRAADPETRPPSPDFERLTPDGWASFMSGATGWLLLLPERLVMYRRHSQNTAGPIVRETRRQRAMRSRELRTEANYYANAAQAGELASAYLQNLLPLEGELREASEAGVLRSAARYERYAAAMNRRAELYHATRGPSRLGRLSTNVLRGDYGRRSQGLLGMASLARDIYGLAKRR